ncbi:MAG: transketolase [Candidatus Altiarchaeota archaeon]
MKSEASPGRHRAMSKRLRRRVLEMTHRANSSHVGSCLSAIDILSVLYGGILRIDPKDPKNARRDRFILSKGHAAAALYAALAESGHISVKSLEGFCVNGTDLAGHATSGVPGVEVSTGSLGHGLPIACGMALAGSRGRQRFRVFALLSDGECDEGSTWEAALFAGHNRLENLAVIVDYNKIQSFGRVREVMDLEPLADKWRTFGWHTIEIDGHDTCQIEAALERLPAEPGKPTCIIAHTVKGKGVSYMEDRLEWHYKSPNKQQLRSALSELGAG